MERYKKRTILLCLASMLTVVGTFAAENYSNTLMALKVNVGSGGYVNMTAFTQKPYNSPLNINKVNDNTFVIKLNNTDNTASAPDINGYDNIKSIEISTYPYTKEADGCTKIIVKTAGAPALTASQALFISDNTSDNQDSVNQEDFKKEESNSSQETIAEENPESSAESPVSDTNNNKKLYTPTDYKNNTSGSSEYMTILFCASVLLMLIVFIYMFSKEKMAALVGSQGNTDLEDNRNNKKQNKTKKLKSEINKLDKTYTTKTIATSYTYNTTNSENDERNSKNDIEEVQDNIVDLDVIFKETQQSADTDTDDDLADLLKSFTLETEPEEVPEEETFDEELYNDIINNNKLKFSNSDLKKINGLLQVEISTETTEDLKKYLSTSITKPLTKEQILADFISTYSINQNISFSKEDVQAIEKIMSVELGPDFTKDFSTNPARTKIVEKEIKENTGKTLHRTSEIITLSVKNILPDLSKELEKQKGKTIESEVKPTVVYYSEGYEYDKLTVSEDLSVITNDEKQNKHKPSYEAPIVETGYDVSTLSIKDELPDLADAKANPQKYENTVTKQKVDESALLKSIANVTFKPFYEETINEFEQFDDLENDDTTMEQNSPNKELTLPQSTSSKKETTNAEKLLKLIEVQQNERTQKKQSKEESAAFKKELEAVITKKQKYQEKKILEPYNFNGENFKILKTIQCTKESSCKLIHTDNKYIVLGNIANKEIVLKEYTTLKNSEMYIRLNDKADQTKFLVKIGMHKFIISITEDNMEFVMDLC